MVGSLDRRAVRQPPLDWRTLPPGPRQQVRSTLHVALGFHHSQQQAHEVPVRLL
jgi:hypothetical protein